MLVGEFKENRPTSVIVTELAAGLVPGMIILISARDLTAIVVRLARHPEKRNDVHEWMLRVAYAIPLVLPVLAAAVGVVATPIGELSASSSVCARD